MPRPLKPWFHKRKNCWVIEPAGRLVRLADGPKNSETEKEARRQLDILKGQWATNVPLDVGKAQLTVPALIDGYLDLMKATLAERTWYERRRLLEKFAQFCVAHQPPINLVKDCLPLHLVQFLNENPRWSSRDTRAEVVKVVKAAFNWGHDAGIAPPNPFGGKLLREFTFGNTRRPMTQEEFRQLIEACKPSQQVLKDVLQFCYWTGARPKEARTARWEDLDLGRATLTLSEHKTARTLKEYRPRIIHLTDEVVSLLVQIRNRQPGTEFIFTSRRGKPYHRTSIQQNLRRLRRRIHLPEDVKLYGCRHGFGTRAALRGENMAVLAELMGHASGSRVTAHYVHLDDRDGHLKQAMERINRPSTWLLR